jgi:hypothetical protein
MADMYDVSFDSSVGTMVYISKNLPSIPQDATDAQGFELFKAFDVGGEFTEIFNIVDAGEFGGTSEVNSAATLRDGRLQKWLGTLDSGSMGITMGKTSSDPGQKIMRAAAKARALHSFKVVTSDEEVAYFAGYVTGVPKGIGTASDYLSSTLNIEISGRIFESIDAAGV